MTEKEQVLCLDVIQSLRDRFISRGWITVSDKAIHSALVTDDKVEECMHDYQWDLTRGHGGAYVNTWGNGSYEYVRESDGLELFVIYRDRYGTHDHYVELSEEFRLFCGMHERYKSETEREFIVVDDNGNENVVAVINGLEVRIKAKVLRSYLAARRINLLVFVDIMRYSKRTYTELDIKPVQNDIIKEENVTYNYTNLIAPQLDRDKSGGWVMGKCLLRYNTADFDAESYPYFSDDTYEEFIIGYDKNGDEYSYTCDDKKLSNYFVKKEDAPLTVTPVYFRKSVLDKYYNDPHRYQVEYWKGYNLAPPPGASLSKTARARWFEGRFYNPEFPDLKFKYQFRMFNERWGKKYSWPLFLPLAKDDEHRFKTLHCLTQPKNPSDFEEQILSMTKVLIDSLNEVELVKSIDDTNSVVAARLKELNTADKNSVKGGITKFELFLLTEGKDMHEYILFLRNLQELRSSTTAHRKSRNKKNKSEDYFQIQSKTQQVVLEDIFVKGVELLDALKGLFLWKNKD